MYSYSIISPETLVEVPDAEDAPRILPNDRHLSKSAMRALEVLEFFAARARPGRAAEVAQALNLSPSTADQLLKTLASRAYLIFDRRTKHYHPAPRLLGFSALLETSYFGHGRLKALMRELAARTGVAVSLSTPFGRFMQLVEVMAPPDQPYGGAPGHVFPLFSSAAGAAILATWPAGVVRELIEGSPDQLGPLAAHPEAVLMRLGEIRANGHAFGGLSTNAEKCSIAVALPRAGFGTELTLSLRGPVERMKAYRWRFAAVAEEAIAAHLVPTPPA